MERNGRKPSLADFRHGLLTVSSRPIVLFLDSTVFFMIRFALAPVLVALCTSTTLAQEPLIREGAYYGSGEGELTVNLTHIENDIYAISIETGVPMENDIPGCGGGIEGEMLLSAEGGNFFVENEDYDPQSTSPMFSERVCEIGLTFDEDGFLQIEERAGCIAYHGAACGFTGTLVHESAAG